MIYTRPNQKLSDLPYYFLFRKKRIMACFSPLFYF